MKVDLITGGYQSFGEYVTSVRKASLGEYKDGRLDEIEDLWKRKREIIFQKLGKTAGHMEESVDSQGGHTVPTQWAAGIYHAALEDAIVRPRATVFPITTDSLTVRRLVDSDRSSNLFGGITFKWTEERGDKFSAISKPAIGAVELNVHKLVGSCFVSNELEDDTEEFGKFMETSFGQAIRFIEDDAFINGTGAGMPLGIGQAGCRTRVTRNAVGLINWTDIANMAKHLLPRSWESAVWLLNPDVIDELFEATAPAANQATAADLSNRRLWGIPFIPTEKCQAIGTEGDIILADFGHGHYLIADREMRISASRDVKYEDVSLETSETYGFETDETFWKVVLRTDGQPLLSADIAPKRGANDLGMFIVLKTTS